MQIITDLQLHSKYSRAVSPQMNLEGISRWSSKKGINLVATGDWTHPLWFKEIKENLEESSSGIFNLKSRNGHDRSLQNVKFLLSTEISSIYSQGGKVRRVHNLIFSPSIKICEKVINELKKRGANLMADGRPIVGISSKDLLQMVLEIDERILFIPAHIWTPWFSVFGSKSGFDSLEECFGELSDNIYAVETGLSSDPIMNWQIKELETRSIVSFSDAHSGPKLGREATMFTCNIEHGTCNISYQDIADAIKQKPGSHLKIGYTIEFFPEEGKYHWTGHRSCNIRYNALETKKKGVICPVCGQPLTVGVENRVLDLSYKSYQPSDLTFLQNKVGLTFVYDKEKKRRPFVSMVPLLEILLETNDGSPTKAQNEYERLTGLATEFDILLKKPYPEIEKQAGEKLMTAIKTVRERKVFVDPGYDGVFGKVKIFKETQQMSEEKTVSQQTLF
ncbi:MAG: endonuclease Q family protein [Candidatus Roizmanbacteria bacterium]|nr:endonuclease Q family protein [Candidatus Roizmanbacteria bacterium]